MLGYIVFGAMVAQLVTGPWLRTQTKRAFWLRVAHRGSGVLVLVGLAALYISGSRGDLDAYTASASTYEVSAYM